MSCDSINTCKKGTALNAWLPFLLVLVVLAGDYVSKYWIQANLPLAFQIPVFTNFLGIDFAITHATNRGAAWGMLAQYHTYLFYFRIALVFGLVVYTLFYNKNPSWRYPLALIIAGALGNIFDFFIYGHVVDMFRFVFWGYSYPVFNIADSAIFLGVAWLFVLSWGKKE